MMGGGGGSVGGGVGWCPARFFGAVFDSFRPGGCYETLLCGQHLNVKYSLGLWNSGCQHILSLQADDRHAFQLL